MPAQPRAVRPSAAGRCHTATDEPRSQQFLHPQVRRPDTGATVRTPTRALEVGRSPSFILLDFRDADPPWHLVPGIRSRRRTCGAALPTPPDRTTSRTAGGDPAWQRFLHSWALRRLLEQYRFLGRRDRAIRNDVLRGSTCFQWIA